MSTVEAPIAVPVTAEMQEAAAAHAESLGHPMSTVEATGIRAATLEQLEVTLFGKDQLALKLLRKDENLGHMDASNVSLVFPFPTNDLGSIADFIPPTAR